MDNETKKFLQEWLGCSVILFLITVVILGLLFAAGYLFGAVGVGLLVVLFACLFMGLIATID